MIEVKLFDRQGWAIWFEGEDFPPFRADVEMARNVANRLLFAGLRYEERLSFLMHGYALPLGDLPQADLLRLAVDLWRQISEMSGNTMDADLLRRAQEIVRQQNRGFGFDQGVQNVVDSALSVMLRESSQLFGRLLILARMPFDAL